MVEKHKHYKITDWKGLPNYECNYCEFATTDRHEFAKHLDPHLRAGIALREQPPETEDENYGLNVDAQTKEEPKKSKGKKVGK